MPSMETSVALVVCQVNVVESPLLMELGLAESDAVGAAGGGGGGGGGGATFFLQAPSIMMPPSANMSMIHFNRFCFTFSSCVFARPNPVARMKPGGAGELSRFPNGVNQMQLQARDNLLPTPI